MLNSNIKAYIPLGRKIPGVGGWRWAMPRRQILSHLTQKIPTCWYLKTRKQPTPNLKFASPNAKPKCKSVEYRLRWAPNAKFLCWASCKFHVVCVSFICVWKQTQTRFSVEYGLKSAWGWLCDPPHKTGGLFMTGRAEKMCNADRLCVRVWEVKVWNW